jgi:Aspartate/tyrosine/aromatic aminotransferase
MTAVLKLDPAVGGRRYRYGLSKRELSQTSGWLFISRDRAPCPPILGRRPEAAKRLIRCGIGDVTEPLPRAAIEAMKAAAEELGQRETFRGYGPEQGYEFLRSKIASV